MGFINRSTLGQDPDLIDIIDTFNEAMEKGQEKQQVTNRKYLSYCSPEGIFRQDLSTISQPMVLYYRRLGKRGTLQQGLLQPRRTSKYNESQPISKHELMKDLTMTKKEDAIRIRRNKVLDLISKGYSQADIAKELRCSEPTISRDIQDMKEEEETNPIEDHIQGIPFQGQRAITSYDMLILRASSLLDSNDIDKLALIKLIADLQKTRLDLHSRQVVLQKAVEYTKSLQA